MGPRRAVTLASRRESLTRLSAAATRPWRDDSLASHVVENCQLDSTVGYNEMVPNPAYGSAHVSGAGTSGFSEPPPL
eukprot:6007305-Pyramimonas_sp.AAC.1